jgi:hypothetical protein
MEKILYGVNPNTKGHIERHFSDLVVEGCVNWQFLLDISNKHASEKNFSIDIKCIWERLYSIGILSFPDDNRDLYYVVLERCQFSDKGFSLDIFGGNNILLFAEIEDAEAVTVALSNNMNGAKWRVSTLHKKSCPSSPLGHKWGDEKAFVKLKEIKI